MSTAGTLKEIIMANGDTLVWAYDDTLIGKGTGSTTLNPVDLVEHYEDDAAILPHRDPLRRLPHCPARDFISW